LHPAVAKKKIFCLKNYASKTLLNIVEVVLQTKHSASWMRERGFNISTIDSTSLCSETTKDAKNMSKIL
jgi:hypothetical protein